MTEKQPNKRLYEVKDGEKSRLIYAASDGKLALALLKPETEISIPSRQRIVDLMAQGVRPETVEERKRKRGEEGADAAT
jgi:hypothetical protein